MACEPWAVEVDGDTLKISQGYDLAGMWDLPEHIAWKKAYGGATYYERVKGKR